MITATESALAADARAGLWNDPPSLPARWFYDERGSRLFDEITRLPEYYPTRRETEILNYCSDEIADSTSAATLIELGSGMSTKTRLLLDAFTVARPQVRFVPLDVSAEVLTETASVLGDEYPRITIQPVVADFTDTLGGLPGSPGSRLLILLGGTIGNLDPTQRAAFLDEIGAALAPGDHLLLGTDLVKSPSRLVAAYDDSSGVTAAFNRNLIEVLRRELDAEGLYVDDFQHVARWNPAHSRVEMWLRARRPVQAHFRALDRDWRLPTGAEILTEISTKFRLPDLHAELDRHALRSSEHWIDGHGDYCLTLAAVT